MKYELPRGSFGGDKWVDYFHLGQPGLLVNSAAGCRTGTNTITERPKLPGRQAHRGLRPALQLGARTSTSSSIPT
jgi:hypothetical protein